MAEISGLDRRQVKLIVERTYPWPKARQVWLAASPTLFMYLGLNLFYFVIYSHRSPVRQIASPETATSASSAPHVAHASHLNAISPAFFTGLLTVWTVGMVFFAAAIVASYYFIQRGVRRQLEARLGDPALSRHLGEPVVLKRGAMGSWTRKTCLQAFPTDGSAPYSRAAMGYRLSREGEAGFVLDFATVSPSPDPANDQAPSRTFRLLLWAMSRIKGLDSRNFGFVFIPRDWVSTP